MPQKTPIRMPNAEGPQLLLQATAKLEFQKRKAMPSSSASECTVRADAPTDADFEQRPVVENDRAALTGVSDEGLY